MTSSTEVLKTELEKLGCRLPYYNDYRYNPSLSQDVRRKMAEHKTKWSLTTSNGSGFLNFYKEEDDVKGTPYIIHLSELIDLSRSSNLFSKSLIFALNQLGKNKLPTHIDVLRSETQDGDVLGLAKDSVILLEQIRTLDKRRLKEKMGHLDERLMRRVDDAITISFGLSDAPIGQSSVDSGNLIG